MTEHICPLCSHTLLCHIRLGKLYWFCRHCYQEIPIAENVDPTKMSLENTVSNAITEYKQAALRQQVEQELERLNRLKDDFLSTISHELRTPLANMKMAIQMLEIAINQAGTFCSDAKPKIERSKVAHYLQILHQECDREISLINDLLDLQQLDAGTQPLMLTTIRLQDWVPHVVEPFEERIRCQQLSLRVDISEELPPVTTDLANLGRILTELLNNACKYTPPGKQITLSANVQSGKIQLKVSNSGVEIPTSELPRIFDTFYRIKSADPFRHPGTGLGLALAQKLAVHLGGSIWAESASGQTCFTVESPDQKSGSTTTSAALSAELLSYAANWIRGKTLSSHPVDTVLVHAIKEAEGQDWVCALRHQPQMQRVPIVGFSAEAGHSLSWVELILEEDYVLLPLGGDRLADAWQECSRPNAAPAMLTGTSNLASFSFQVFPNRISGFS